MHCFTRECVRAHSFCSYATIFCVILSPPFGLHTALSILLRKTRHPQHTTCSFAGPKCRAHRRHAQHLPGVRARGLHCLHDRKVRSAEDQCDPHVCTADPEGPGVLASEEDHAQGHQGRQHPGGWKVRLSACTRRDFKGADILVDAWCLSACTHVCQLRAGCWCEEVWVLACNSRPHWPEALLHR